MNSSKRCLPFFHSLIKRNKLNTNQTSLLNANKKVYWMNHEHPCRRHYQIFTSFNHSKKNIPETFLPFSSIKNSSLLYLIGLATAGYLLPHSSNFDFHSTHCDSSASSPEPVATELEPTPSLPDLKTTKPNSNPDPNQSIPEVKKKLVILGSGWGAVSLLKGLNTKLYDVSIISPRNYFLFTPLLPEVSSGSLESRSISEPIRKIIRMRKKDANFYEAECTHIDPINQTVKCKDSSDYYVKGKDEFEIKYDYLVIAVGAENNTFNTPGVKEYCHFLKEIEDAEKLLQLVVDCFETASLPSMDEEEIKKTLHFVIVGGGPTGVEFAAELHDLIQNDFSKLYPKISKFAKITLVQSGDHILNMFDKRISEFAEKKFQRDKINVKTNFRVVEVKEKEIIMFDKTKMHNVSSDYGLIVWSTGIGQRPLIIDLMRQIDQNNRRALCTDEWLKVKHVDNIWAIGDCSTIEQRKMMEDISYIFEMADTNKDGVLTVKEIKIIMQKLKERYPQISFFLKNKSIQQLLGKEVDGMGDTDEQTSSNRTISIDEFKSTVEKVDKTMKNLPATAQVAAQQGNYLCRVFNHMHDDSFLPEGPPHVHQTGRHKFHPFMYKHLGQFAPLGGGKAGFELPGDWVSVGRSSQWLWYSVYFSKQVSWRTKSSVLFDWIRRGVFGRDSSRI